MSGLARRRFGQQAATGVVAGVLFVMTILLTLSLIRFLEVEIVPRSRSLEMDRWADARRESVSRASSVSAAATMGTGTATATALESGHSKKARAAAVRQALAETEASRPVMLGNPVGRARRCNLLELGAPTRWTEIRRANNLLDEYLDDAGRRHEAQHPNRGAFGDAVGAAMGRGRGW
jgi:hypothetical protein